MTLPARWLSIDPGDVHVGMALWEHETCVGTFETTPELCIETLEANIGDTVHNAYRIDAVVYERFALYAWNEKSLSGNEFLTAQLIGVIKYLCGAAQRPCTGYLAGTHKAIYKMGWFTSLSNTEKRQQPWWGHGPHAKDAWCLGAWHVRKMGV